MENKDVVELQRKEKEEIILAFFFSCSLSEHKDNEKHERVSERKAIKIMRRMLGLHTKCRPRVLENRDNWHCKEKWRRNSREELYSLIRRKFSLNSTGPYSELEHKSWNLKMKDRKKRIHRTKTNKMKSISQQKTRFNQPRNIFIQFRTPHCGPLLFPYFTFDLP